MMNGQDKPVIDWDKGLTAELLALIAGGRDEVKAMHVVSKSWKTGYGLSINSIKSCTFSHPPALGARLAEDFPFAHTWDPSKQFFRIWDVHLDWLLGFRVSTLSLRGCQSISGAGLARLRGLPLTDLDLGECQQLTDGDLARLEGMPLRRLSLEGCRGLTDAGLRHLAGMPLEELDLGRPGRRVTPGALRLLRTLPLRRLSLDGWERLCEPGALANLRELPQLRSLSMGSNPYLLAPCLGPLKGLQLTELGLPGCFHLSDSALEVFRGMPIASLNLRGWGNDAVLKSLEGMPLQRLDLGYSDVTGKGLRELNGMPIAELRLRGCRRIRDRDLEGLLGLPLTLLDLSECVSITDEGLGFLRGMPLTQLGLKGCVGVTAVRLEVLQGVPLATLELSKNMRLGSEHPFKGLRLTALAPARFG